MNINPMILNALKNLGIPVSFQTYKGSSTTYITFFEYNQFSAFNADNDEIITAYFIQVDVWSKGDYTSLVEQVREKMKEINFRRTSEVDIYEQDTEIYHKALRFRLN
jgi:hypothetical protein